jgi:cell division protease FtsH
MVTRYGMFSDIGAENFVWEIDSYSGQSQKPYISDETIKAIDNKVKTILSDAYDTAFKIITDNKELHEKITQELLKKEELTEEEFAAFFNK